MATFVRATRCRRSGRQLKDDRLDHRGDRHRQERADDAVGRGANEKRQDHRERRQADGVLHDARDQNVRLEQVDRCPS